MAWTTPKTWASEPLTSTDLNTYVRDNQTYLKGRVDGVAAQYIRTATNYSTSSTSLVDIDATEGNMKHTITTTGKDVLVTFTGYWGIGNTYWLTLAVDVDSTPYTILYNRMPISNYYKNGSFSYIFTGLSAGSHVFKMQWKVSNGSADLYAGTTLFDVREITGVIA